MSYDMIRRDALLDYFDAKALNALELWDGGRTREAWLEAFETVRNAPTIDAEPVRHGRWLPTSDENKKRCSRCDVIHLIAQYPHGKANYCPNCGAKMDGDADAPES